MVDRYRHGFFTRMFLRDCAFFIRWWGGKDSYWIWANATYSFSATVGSVVLSSWVLLTIGFHDKIPGWLNVFKLEKGVALIIFGLVGVLLSLFVDFCFRDFEGDVSEANQYMTASDRLKWWLACFVTIGCPIGMGFVLFKLCLGANRCS